MLLTIINYRRVTVATIWDKFVITLTTFVSGVVNIHILVGVPERIHEA